MSRYFKILALYGHQIITIDHFGDRSICSQSAYGNFNWWGKQQFRKSPFVKSIEPDGYCRRWYYTVNFTRYCKEREREREREREAKQK